MKSSSPNLTISSAIRCCVGGIGQGFEATLNYRIHDGHDERTGFFNVGGGTGEHGQFALSVDLTGAAFQLDRLFVEVFEESAAGRLGDQQGHRAGDLRAAHRARATSASGSTR